MKHSGLPFLSFRASSAPPLPSWIRFELLTFLIHCCFSITCGIRSNLWTKLWWVIEVFPLHAMTSAWFSRKDGLVDSWTSTAQAYFVLEPCWMLQASLPVAVEFLCPFSCKALPPPLELPPFSLRYWWFLEIHCLPDRWKKCLSLVEHNQVLASRLPILFLFFKRVFHLERILWILHKNLTIFCSNRLSNNHQYAFLASPRSRCD